MKFYSPYQFIPVTGKIHRRGDDGHIVRDAENENAPKDVETTLYEDIKGGRTHIRHDRWQTGCLSGRLVCRLTTKSPVLIGAGQTEGDERTPGEIRNYRVQGQIAIPGSSLRGMTGNVAEAISQSALRVLPNAEYSVRMDMRAGFRAIGLLSGSDNSNWRLLPLALTSIPFKHQPAIDAFRAKWFGVFPPESPIAECLAAYYGNYGSEDIAANYRCFQSRWASEFFYLPNTPSELNDISLEDALNGTLPGNALEIRRNIAFRRRVFNIMSEIPQDAQRQRGVLYVLGRREGMPRKHHEWFVPYSEDWEELVAASRENGLATLPVPPHVTNAFETIAADRDASNKVGTPPIKRLPYLPAGYDGRKARQDGKGGYLRDGDLVYFDVDENGNNVTGIAYSSIWRRKIRGHLHDAFSNGHRRDDILPWNQDRKSKGLTPAECLFGVVEEQPGAESRNLSSRLFFSDAQAIDAVKLLDQVPLKTLSAPKPPSPAMYFHSEANGVVTKDDLDLEMHRPNGRKYYLHHRSMDWESHWSWMTNNLANDEEQENEGHSRSMADYTRQGGRCGSPIAPGEEFYFHIDFDNLSPGELELIRVAVNPAGSPSSGEAGDRFYHKIGWGKPIALGSVEIEILGTFFIERISRYTKIAVLKNAPRYSMFDVDKNWSDPLRRRYGEEASAMSDGSSAQSWTAPKDSSLIDEEALTVILKLGNPSNLRNPVTYPISSRFGQTPGCEINGFKWFAQNLESLWQVDNDYYSSLPELHDHQGFLTLYGLNKTLSDKLLKEQIRERLRPYEQGFRPSIEIIRNDADVPLALVRLHPDRAEELLVEEKVRTRTPKDDDVAKAYKSRKSRGRNRR